jgi:hypothetical protein
LPDINQYAARSGRIIKENGTLVNEADGINADGSRNVQLMGSVVTQPIDIQARYAELYSLGEESNRTSPASIR